MNSPTFVRILALIVGVTVLVLIGLYFLIPATVTESATKVLQKSGVAQSQALAALGPNTTFHTVIATHRPQSPDVANISEFAVPDDTVTEAFMVFDDAGMLKTYSQISRGTDGVIYQHAQLVGNDLVNTDVKSGASRVSIPNFCCFAAAALAGRYASATTAAIAATTPDMKAESASIDGKAAFVIATPSVTNANRTYIDKSTYLPLRSEQLAPDGHVTEYTTYVTQEVLSATPATTTATTSPPAPRTATATR